MKTPRELLLEKHRGAIPALNEIRRAALEVMRDELSLTEQRPPQGALSWKARLREWVSEFSRKLWSELIVPNRKAWATLASVWLVILGFSIASSVDSSQPTIAKMEPLSPETRMALRHQQQELAKLIESLEPEPVEAPRRGIPPQTFVHPQWILG